MEQSKQSISERSTAEGNLFKIDIIIQGIPQNAVLEDQGSMTTKIQYLVQTLRTQHQTESVIADLNKTGNVQ